MKGHQHFRTAENCLDTAKEADFGSPVETYYLLRAQVHATLSLAVAASNLVKILDAALIDHEPDKAEPPRAEPLVKCNALFVGAWKCVLPIGHDGPHEPPNGADVDEPTCNAAPADDGLERCGLAAGHDGVHEYDAGGGRIVSWSTPAEVDAITPEPALPGLCGCGHIEARHAPHMYGLASQPRGVCLSGCGCIGFEPESAPESAEVIA